MDYKTLLVEQRGAALHVTLNRPEVHNAFNDELIHEAVDFFSGLKGGAVRAIVLRGSGPNFCAGADLNWMAKMVSYGRDENVRDAALLAKMFAVIDECPIPVIGRVQGAAIGGGVGLVAACDIAISMESSKFGLSEVKLGILPAVISPYVIGKIGASHARALFLTGERFPAARALAIGLVHRLTESEVALDAAVDETVSNLTSSGPEAVAECKKLIDFVASNNRAASIPYTIEAIAQRRVSAEGQEGMSSFLKKGKPAWSRG